MTAPLTRCRAALLSVLIFLAPAYLQSQHNLDDHRAVMAVYHENEDERLAGIPQVLERVFLEAGIQSVTYSAEGVSLEQVQKACDEAGARWGLTVRTSFKDERLYWHFSVYDAQERSVMGSDSFDAAF